MKVIVTGNARSGTSFLTNLIHKLTGYNCGNDLRQADPNNKFGYWEHKKLNDITNQCIRSVGLNYVTLSPVKNIDFSKDKFNPFRKQIENIVNKQNIELYKDNKLLLAPGLYTRLYPEAKWVYIQRNMEDSFRSKFGKKMSFEEYSNMVKNRLDCWDKKNVSKSCLTLNYEDFEKDIDGTIKKLVDYFEVSDYDINTLKKVYKNKNKR